jgi:cytochrome c oxidase assembly protein subunit 15
MDFLNGYTLWRHLGKTAGGDYLPFAALTAIHWTHRTFAYLVVVIVAWVGHKALRTEGLHRTGKWLLIVIVVQFLIGMSTIFLRWPLALAVAHNGGAALLMLLLLMLNYKTRISLIGTSQRAATRLSTA